MSAIHSSPLSFPLSFYSVLFIVFCRCIYSCCANSHLLLLHRCFLSSTCPFFFFQSFLPSVSASAPFQLNKPTQTKVWCETLAIFTCNLYFKKTLLVILYFRKSRCIPVVLLDLCFLQQEVVSISSNLCHKTVFQRKTARLTLLSQDHLSSWRPCLRHCFSRSTNTFQPDGKCLVHIVLPGF